ncbi:MAG: hypothetical protein ABIK68_00800, partial [bacterium]
MIKPIKINMNVSETNTLKNNHQPMNQFTHLKRRGAIILIGFLRIRNEVIDRYKHLNNYTILMISKAY